MMSESSCLKETTLRSELLTMTEPSHLSESPGSTHESYQSSESTWWIEPTVTSESQDLIETN